MAEAEPEEATEEQPEEQAPDLATLQNEIAELRAQLEAANRASEGDVILSSVQAQLNAIDPNDPQAFERVRAFALQLGQGYGSTYSTAVEKTAEVMAADLVEAHGGKRATYKGDLIKAQKEAQQRGLTPSQQYAAMEIAAKELSARLQSEAKPKASTRRPSVDEGRGSAQRGSVLDEMHDIDPSTPEGARLWEEKRGAFLRALSARR